MNARILGSASLISYEDTSSINGLIFLSGYSFRVSWRWLDLSSQNALKLTANMRIKNSKKVAFDMSKMKDVFVKEASIR